MCMTPPHPLLLRNIRKIYKNPTPLPLPHLNPTTPPEELKGSCQK